MEGYADTGSEFLDDPTTIIPGAPGAIRLDNPEKLVDDGSWHRPKARPRSSGSCINDLTTHRWHSRFLSLDQEIDAISRIQAADICGPLRSSFQGFRDFAKLLADNHWPILKLARKPIGKAQRGAGKDKHNDTLFYEDLLAAGVAAMWRAALHFDLAAGYRFWTPAHIAVVGAISDEARLWRRGGSGEGKLDRWLYTHPTASPEQVLRAQERLLKRPWFRSFEEAAEGIKQFWAWGTDANIDFDEDMEAAAGTFRSMYDCFDPYQLSYSYSDSDGMAAPADSRLSYLKIHKRFSLVVDRLSGGLDTRTDVGEVRRPKMPRDLDDCTETAVIRFKNGKRQVTRQKASLGYRQSLVDFLAGKYPDNLAPRPPGRPIPITAELQARAEQDLEFATQRWQRRIRRGPMPGKQYSRWSTIGEAGRAEHENKQIIPAYVPITRFTWKVEYRGAEGDLLSVLESPSRHCQWPEYHVHYVGKKPDVDCEICEATQAGSRSHHVALPPLLPRRAVGRRSAAVDRILRGDKPADLPVQAPTKYES